MEGYCCGAGNMGYSVQGSGEEGVVVGMKIRV